MSDDACGTCESCGQAPPNFEAELEFLYQYMSLSEKNRIAIGHQFSDFFKECTFGGVDCLNET